MNHMKNNNDYFKPIEKGSIEDAAQKVWNKEVELDERIRIDKRTKSVTLDVKKSESGELQRYLNSQRSKEKFEWHPTKDGKIIISPKDAGKATFPKFMIAFMNAKKTGKFGSVKIVSTDEEVEFDEVYTDYNQLAKDIQKEYQKKLRSKKFITKNDIEDYVSTNADSPHKVETDEIIKALKKLRVSTKEGVEFDEVYTDYKQLAKDIQKEYQKKLRSKKFITTNDIDDYVSTNADSPHKVETDEIIKALKKLRVTVTGKFPHKREEVELDEKQNTYTVVHIKKGKEIIKAKSSYEAAKKFAQMKRLKNTAGVDAYIMEEVELDEAYWKVSIPDMPPIFIEAGSAGVIKANLRKKLKGDAFKELKIEKVSRGDMIKKYREMAKGDSGGEESSESTVLEEVELDENFRTLATKGMGTETKANAKVGQELDFYEPKNGDKFLGKIIKTKYGPAGFYQILGLDRQVKGKVFTFKYYDKDKAKNLLKNESKKLVEKGTSPSRYIEILNRLREETEYQKFFMSALKKFGVKSPAELDGEKEKKFYDYVDKNWKAKNEPKEVGEKHKPKQNGKTLTGKPKDKIDVNPQTSDIRAGKY
jgi:hypothetical protein